MTSNFSHLIKSRAVLPFRHMYCNNEYDPVELFSFVEVTDVNLKGSGFSDLPGCQLQYETQEISG